MTTTSNVYLIWYGCWGASTCGSNAAVTQIANGVVTYGGSATDSYSRGKSLVEEDVAAIVSDHLAAAHLPVDPAGLYTVIASRDVVSVDPMTNVCSLQGHSTFNGTRIRYAFVGGNCASPLQD